ncbi:MAG: phosphoribosylanthranilate isomerase [Candidatus Azotimanducaceae bacterium]|jgi:phosphoribosylanthranilate isomerase
MYTRVKICGITNLQDALLAIDAGADSLGFNMYHASPRFISAELAAEIMDQMPPFVTTVGLFVNEEADQIRKLCQDVSFDLLQFHGDENDEFCQQFNRPFLKAIRVNKIADIVVQVEAYPSAKGILVDTLVKGKYGGTGAALNWDNVPKVSKPIILAGGLIPENVSMAISKVRPYSVDVSSGVESSAGIKDKNKIELFMNAVKATNIEVGN